MLFQEYETRRLECGLQREALLSELMTEFSLTTDKLEHAKFFSTRKMILDFLNSNSELTPEEVWQFSMELLSSQLTVQRDERKNLLLSAIDSLDPKVSLASIYLPPCALNYIETGEPCSQRIEKFCNGSHRVNMSLSPDILQNVEFIELCNNHVTAFQIACHTINVDRISEYAVKRIKDTVSEFAKLEDLELKAVVDFVLSRFEKMPTASITERVLFQECLFSVSHFLCGN
jgi:hypothetical protein